MEYGHFLDLINIYSFDNYLLCAMCPRFSIFFSYCDLFNSCFVLSFP